HSLREKERELEELRAKLEHDRLHQVYLNNQKLLQQVEAQEREIREKQERQRQMEQEAELARQEARLIQEQQQQQQLQQQRQSSFSVQHTPRQVLLAE